jgi:hypothetical protein
MAKSKKKLKFKGQPKIKQIIREPFNLISSTDIKKLQSKVDDLQIKIALAIKNRMLKNAERLVTILVRSKAAQLLAVRKVITNTGARSPGWSKKVLTTNSEYAELLKNLREIVCRPKTYKASPLYFIEYTYLSPTLVKNDQYLFHHILIVVYKHFIIWHLILTEKHTQLEIATDSVKGEVPYGE